MAASFEELREDVQPAYPATNQVCEDCKSRTVVVLDDDALQLQVVEMLLHSCGVTAICCTSAAEALNCVSMAEHPLTVLMDLRIPGHDPVVFCAALRVMAPSIRIVAMSASTPHAVETPLTDHFLLKPLSRESLHEALWERRHLSCDVTEAHLEGRTYETFARQMSPAGLQSLYDAYFVDARRRIAAMRGAAVSGDLNLFSAAAHALKGASGMLGLTVVWARAGELETVDSLASTTQASDLIAAAETAIASAMTTLAARLHPVADIPLVPPLPPHPTAVLEREHP